MRMKVDLNLKQMQVRRRIDSSCYVCWLLSPTTDLGQCALTRLLYWLIKVTGKHLPNEIFIKVQACTTSQRMIASE